MNAIRSIPPAVLLALAAAASAQSYSVEVLDTLGGPTSAAWAVNASGAAAGVSTVPIDSGAAFHATRWIGPPTDLGLLPGQTQTLGLGIRPDGGVIGIASTVGQFGDHAFLAYPGLITDLGAFQAKAVNTAGHIAGNLTVTLPGGWRTIHACRYTGAPTDLGTLGGSSSAGLAINDAGWIAGSSFHADQIRSHACLWTATTPIDLGTLPGGGDSQISALNNSHLAAGFSRPVGGPPHAMLITLNDAGQPVIRTDLGTLGGAGWSFAYGLNDAGDVVGTSNDAAVLWTGGGIADLNTRIPPGSGWVLQAASAINASGQIVGWGLHHGQPRAFRLTPGACYADCDGSGELDIDDFICFQTRFGTGDPGADCDGSGELDIDDFICFQTAFGVGCP